jgi:hypothetical protein
MADGARVSEVVLTSRATNVPFTAVMAGAQRMVTGNAKAALELPRDSTLLANSGCW